jgi:hypothetical protein
MSIKRFIALGVAVPTFLTASLVGLDQAAMAAPAPQAVKPATITPIAANSGSADPQFWGAVAQAAANAAAAAVAGAAAAAVVAAVVAPKSSSSSSGGPANSASGSGTSGDAMFDVAG